MSSLRHTPEPRLDTYLDAARRSISENYGSLQGYLDAAGVTLTRFARFEVGA